MSVKAKIDVANAMGAVLLVLIAMLSVISSITGESKMLVF